MSFQKILANHKASQNRKTNAQLKLDKARQSFQLDPVIGITNDVCVFAAGSLGRLDSGNNSDLDVFVTAMGEKVSRLQEILYFSSIVKVNNDLNFPPLSNDGEFLKIFHIPDNQEKIGSAVDDSENWFTTRMLLLLESNYLSNEEAYHRHKKAILEFYFRDSDGKDFKPVFLLNDILRYWRTLCLNYEQKARASNAKSWKKKNFNLKFSRLLSVFGTILPLILMKNVTADGIEQLSSKVPMDRLALGLDYLMESRSLQERFEKFLDYYEFFLNVKETQNFDKLTNEIKINLQEKADFIAEFIFESLNHETVPQEFKRYLVI